MSNHNIWEVLLTDLEISPVFGQISLRGLIAGERPGNLGEKKHGVPEKWRNVSSLF